MVFRILLLSLRPLLALSGSRVVKYHTPPALTPSRLSRLQSFILCDVDMDGGDERST